MDIEVTFKVKVDLESIQNYIEVEGLPKDTTVSSILQAEAISAWKYDSHLVEKVLSVKGQEI